MIAANRYKFINIPQGLNITGDDSTRTMIDTLERRLWIGEATYTESARANFGPRIISGAPVYSSAVYPHITKCDADAMMIQRLRLNPQMQSGLIPPGGNDVDAIERLCELYAVDGNWWFAGNFRQFDYSEAYNPSPATPWQDHVHRGPSRNALEGLCVKDGARSYTLQDGMMASRNDLTTVSKMIREHNGEYTFRSDIAIVPITNLGVKGFDTVLENMGGRWTPSDPHSYSEAVPGITPFFMETIYPGVVRTSIGRFYYHTKHSVVTDIRRPGYEVLPAYDQKYGTVASYAFDLEHSAWWSGEHVPAHVYISIVWSVWYNALWADDYGLTSADANLFYRYVYNDSPEYLIDITEAERGPLIDICGSGGDTFDSTSIGSRIEDQVLSTVGSTYPKSEGMSNPRVIGYQCYVQPHAYLLNYVTNRDLDL